MMRKYMRNPIAILGCLLMSFTFAHAQMMPEGMPKLPDQGQVMTDPDAAMSHLHHKLDVMTVLLKLGVEQRSQIEALLTDAMMKNQELRQQKRAAKMLLKELAHTRPFDESAFRNAAMDFADKKIDLKVSRIKVKIQVFELLNPEQQEKAEVLHALVKKLMKGKHH